MAHYRIDPSLSRITSIGNYLPRQCGIATFTTDLCESIAALVPDRACSGVAMNDTAEGYAYPLRAKFEIEANRREQYDTAADYINLSQSGVVCVQHEYGIYASGACYDGLHSDRVNENQGAGSTVCRLLALLGMYEIEDEANAEPERAVAASAV